MPQIAHQMIPARRGKTQLKNLTGFSLDAAAIQVAPRHTAQGILYQHMPVKSQGQTIEGEHFLALGEIFHFLRRDPLLRQTHAIPVGQLLDRFRETDALLLHQKAEDIAAFAATKAIIHVFLGSYRKRRRFLGMKRAQSHPVLPRLLERHELTDDIDDAAGIANFVDGFFRYVRRQLAVLLRGKDKMGRICNGVLNRMRPAGLEHGRRAGHGDSLWEGLNVLNELI